MQSNQSTQLNKLNKSNRTSRLVLGTAQLGMNYGISNRTGKPDLITAESIVKTAWESGICEFDTAQAYGESEKTLGHCLSRLGITKKASIISKPHPDLDHLNLTKMQMALEASLNNLKSDHLYGYLLHREELLDHWDKGLGEILVNFVEKKRLVENIGISVYSPERAIQALGNDHISIVQIPSNILDRRFENAGVFELAGRLRKTVYVRSVFLQGLILMNDDEVPSILNEARPFIRKISDLVLQNEMNKLKLAIGYTKYAYPNAKIVIGAETQEQVIENVTAWKETGRKDTESCMLV